MRRLVLSLLATGICALAFASPASASYWRHCGSQPQPGAGWGDVKAHAIDCTAARRVANRYAHSPDKTPYGFSCSSTAVGDELSRIACRREAGGRVQKVRFSVGA